jgi:hypothetical protein
MKVIIQKKNGKWYLGTWENNVFTREKTYAKINGSGIKKEHLDEDVVKTITAKTSAVKVYGVKEEVVKKRGRKANPDKPKAPKKEELKVDENMSDNKKEKAFEKTFWKVKHPTCLRCKKTCKQSAMVNLYCPVQEKI